MTKNLAENTMSFFTGLMCGTYRKSFAEEAISRKLVDFADERGLWCSRDGEGNVIVYKAGTGKYARADFPVILQAHMDMVCVSEPDIPDAFAEGIVPYHKDGDNTKMYGRSAKYPNVKTTLGADNGIGVAAICAVLDDKELVHPPIVAIFTTGEEEGMAGAAAVTYEAISKAAHGLDLSKAKLINLDDSDAEGRFGAGCAGGQRGTVTLPAVRESAMPAGVEYYTLHIGGLTGGHSGTCIHEGRANANILLFDVLQRLTYTGIGLSLAALGKCGTASNVIPSQASAVIAVKAGQGKQLISTLSPIEKHLVSVYASTDPNLVVRAVPCRSSGVQAGNGQGVSAMDVPDLPPYDANTLSSLLSIVRAFPNGPFTWDTNAAGSLVETSSNLGIIEERGGNIILSCLIRSSVDAMKARVAGDMEALSGLYGAKFESGSDSPGWVYKRNNALRDLFMYKYRELFGVDALALASHGGLECGHFARVLGDIDIIAACPTVSGKHSVEEALHTDTVPRFMDLLTAVLENL